MEQTLARFAKKKVWIFGGRTGTFILFARNSGVPHKPATSYQIDM